MILTWSLFVPWQICCGTIETNLFSRRDILFSWAFFKWSYVYQQKHIISVTWKFSPPTYFKLNIEGSYIRSILSLQLVGVSLRIYVITFSCTLNFGILHMIWKWLIVWVSLLWLLTYGLSRDRVVSIRKINVEHSVLVSTIYLFYYII
jgi:hypothetical protein